MLYSECDMMRMVYECVERFFRHQNGDVIEAATYGRTYDDAIDRSMPYSIMALNRNHLSNLPSLIHTSHELVE